MDLGLITDCSGFGSVTSDSGDYVGGIAGQSGATVRQSYAKCTLSGTKYVGGIIGAGAEQTVSGRVQHGLRLLQHVGNHKRCAVFRRDFRL